MSLHGATVDWTLGDGLFTEGRYSRVHRLEFGGDLVVAGSPSPRIVPAPYSRLDAVDPESAFVAALAACHMLWFLDLAAKGGWIVTAYRDAAEGAMGRIGSGRIAMTRVVLKPAIQFSGAAPGNEALAALHEAAHHRCFIANSVTTEVVVEAAG